MCKKLGVAEQTYYRWRKEYGGMRTDQAKRLKELEKQNARLKQVVADQALFHAKLCTLVHLENHRTFKRTPLLGPPKNTVTP